MTKSKRTMFARGLRGAFSWSGHSLPVGTVMLAVIAGWSSGCSTSPYCDERGNYGVCYAMAAQASGVQYGEREPADEDVSASASYVCAPSYTMEHLGEWSGGIECLDPETGVDEWDSKDWGVYLDVYLPSEMCSCGGVWRSCSVGLEVIFDQPDGIPQSGVVFDLKQARIFELYVAGGADYVITGGTIEFVTVEADQYSFKIQNLTLTRIAGEGEAEPSDCYIPETVVVESISVSCEPEVWNLYGC